MTVEQMSQTDAANSTLYRPGGRINLDQKRTHQRQNNDSTDLKVEHRAGQTKTDTIIKLIGSKALTQCNLNGLTVRALLDTGAQVSIVDRV